MSARILRLDYGVSELRASTREASLHLALERGRVAPDGDAARSKKKVSAVGLRGRVKDRELFRDALLGLFALRESDLRYKGRDRAAYLAFLMKQGKKATAAIWDAQRSFLEGAYSDDAARPRGLDPILTVDPDGVALEVFSRDESAYARLAFSNELFEERAASHGTTFALVTPELVEQLERLRTYQPLTFEAGTEPSADGRTTVAREIDLPDEWLRGFLQVQSAAVLPAVSVPIAPVDLYSVLFALRTRRAKKAPRGLRFELTPGARPRIVIEPWEVAIETHGSPYQGGSARIVRIFGRQRLLALSAVLPQLRSVRLELVGPGLPSFFVLDMGLATLSVALTSWSESRWSSVASFDSLVPRSEDSSLPSKLVALLHAAGPLSLEAIAKQASVRPPDARVALQRACLRGEALFDLAKGVYRPRALFAEPVDDARVRYGSPREAAAHRLLGDRGAGTGSVRVTKVHAIAGEGEEISGEIDDKVARRSFSPRFTLDLEAQVRAASCTCPTYQRSGVREGPCEHLIALRLQHLRDLDEAEARRATPEGRRLIRAETRTLLHRDPKGVQTSVRISLDDRVVRIEERRAAPGVALGDGEHQRVWYDTDSLARDAYFARLDVLAGEGFVDLGGHASGTA